MLIFEPLGLTRRPSDKPTGTNNAELPLTNPPPIPTINAPSSGKSSVCVTTRSRASAPSSSTVFAPPPGSKMPPRKPRSNFALEMRYAPSIAVPPPLGNVSTTPSSDRENARYGALKLGNPVACAAAHAAVGLLPERHADARTQIPGVGKEAALEVVFEKSFQPPGVALYGHPRANATIERELIF